ncbi:kinase-like domain-containing protein, partial [Crucibulum laeve]
MEGGGMGILPDSDLTNMKRGELFSQEVFWRDHQPWLKSCGYLLRPRYQPDWVASWIKDTSKEWPNCEDGESLLYPDLNDAIRVSDGSLVMIKRLQLPHFRGEVEAGRFFSTEPLASDPRNHCIPFLDVLEIPDQDNAVLIVMPLLQDFGIPPFETIGEVVDFFGQLFEGLYFMHINKVAHRDCKFNNVMMDATKLYPSPPHPINLKKRRDYTGPATPTTRTLKPVKYYFIDFGLSRRYDLAAPLESRLEEPGWGGDDTVPEFTKGTPCDPFPVDVYCLGNLIRRHFLKGFHHIKAKRGLRFMDPLIADMTREDPKDRPTMEQVVKRFEEIRGQLSGWKLRSRLVDADESPISGVFRSVVHWTKQVGLIGQRVQPIP